MNMWIKRESPPYILVNNSLSLSEIVTSSTDPVRKFAGEAAVLSCVATAASSVDIKWRKKATDWTESNKKYDALTAQQDNYDTSSGTRKSTLTIGSPATTDTSDSIECYDETIGISGVMTLEVIGKTKIDDIMSLHVLQTNSRSMIFTLLTIMS